MRLLSNALPITTISLLRRVLTKTSRSPPETWRMTKRAYSSAHSNVTRRELLDFFTRELGEEDADLWKKFHGQPPFSGNAFSKVILSGTSVASHVCCVPRPMRVGSSIVDAHMVGYVATAREYRRQGLAARLIKAWIDELTRRGNHLLFLTGILDFYEQFGFSLSLPLDSADSPLTLSVARIPKYRGRLTVRSFRKDDVPALAELYQRQNIARTGSIVRSVDYWKWLLEGLHASGWVKSVDILVAQNAAHDVVGYIILHQGDLGRLDVWEASTTSGDALAALMEAIGARARADGQPRVDLKAPMDHEIANFAMAHGASLTAYSEGVYARILNLRDLFSRLKPEFEQRLVESSEPDWRGTIRLTTDIGTVELRIGNGRVEIGNSTDDPACVLVIPQALLVKLIMGYADVAGVFAFRAMSGRGTTRLPRSLWKIAPILFPKGCPYVWNADLGY